MVREEHGLVHVQVVELAAHLAGRPDGLRTVRAARPRDAVFRPRRHRGQVEVALLDLRDLAQRDVPGRLGVLGELGRILVDVDVRVDDEEVGERLATLRALGCAEPSAIAKDHMIGLVRGAERARGESGIGSFHVHRGHAFEGFELRGGELAALCSCGSTLDVADAVFSRCPACRGAATVSAALAPAPSSTTRRSPGGSP